MKPKIFISHITEEKEVADVFKAEIEAKFLGMVDVFVSSDATSLRLGRNWLIEITTALRGCAAMLVFCSPYSIRRPWINFECGAGWARDIEIAPLCHSGLRPVDLPLPISLLQGLEAADPNKVSQVFGLIADKLGSQVPPVDGTAISAKVKAFERKYTEEMEITSYMRRIQKASPQLFDAISQIPVNTVQTIERVPERMLISVSDDLNALQERGCLEYNFAANILAFGTPGKDSGGISGIITIKLNPSFRSALQSLTAEP